MEDLNEAMDHFLDIFKCLFDPRMGFDGEPQEGLVEQLEGMAYAASRAFPEAAPGLLEVVKQACAAVRSTRLPEWPEKADDLDDQEDALSEIGKVLMEHSGKIQDYFLSNVVQQLIEKNGKSEEDLEVVVVEGESADSEKPKESEWTSID